MSARRKPNLNFEPDSSEIYVSESGSWIFRNQDQELNFPSRFEAENAQGNWRVENGYSRYTGERV